jgi:hypothetical protein
VYPPAEKTEDDEMENKGTSLIAHLSEIDDPRIDRTRHHKLLDILVIAICAVICGADDWVKSRCSDWQRK